MDILESLNPKQKQAVTIMRGPVLVISGPGSGKTRCLTHRIAYLIQQNIPASNILAVTFTNKAAQEMKQRVKELIEKTWECDSQKFGNRIPKSILPIIGTFHAVCLQILRREIDKLGYSRNFIIYDEADQVSLIKEIVNQLGINPDQFKPSMVQAIISHAKDELIDPKMYQEQAEEYFPQRIAKIYQAYQTNLKKAEALDFDDLIMLVVRLFQKKPEILEKYQNKWKYILVDEAHDTNFSQYTLTNLLAQKHKNLWFIADTDQSIYSWRGADFRNILNFEKDYPEAKTILLEQNYRSTKNILLASEQIISQNTLRKEKKLWTKNPKGDLIKIVELLDEQEEGNFLIEEMENLISQGFQLRDFSVLYRTNAQSRAIEEAMLKSNFPYKITGSVRFYDRKEIKDILAYLKLIANPNDIVSCKRIVNTPPRRLAKYTKGQTLMENLTDLGLRDFYKLIHNFHQASQRMPLVDLIKLIIEKTDYQAYILKDKKDGERRWENVQELFTVAEQYNRFENKLGLEKFLEQTALLSSHDEVETEKNLVNLMTLHCSKGLEFPVVFMTGCEEGILPHSKSTLNKEQMEEERRLCYVGLTRAKQKAYLTFVQKRRLWGQTMVNPRSRFLSGIPEHLIEFRN